MAQSRAKTIVLWVISVLVGLMFVMVGSRKLLNPAEAAKLFEHFGYSAMFAKLIGVVELASGASLFVPRVARYGALMLAAVMIGAVFTHIRAGEMNRVAFPLILMTLSAVIAVMRWRNA
jgi:putative oxidoreductase